MFKQLLVLFLTVIVLLFSSCSLEGRGTMKGFISTDEYKAEGTLKTVIKAMENKDKDAIKAVFSKEALDMAADIDDNIESLFDFLQGKVESWDSDGGPEIYEELNNGLKLKRSVLFSIVTTEEQEYFFFLLEYLADRDNPDNVGLYTLLVMNAEDAEEHFGYWQDNVFPGIKCGVE
jgi:hypothetical protein